MPIEDVIYQKRYELKNVKQVLRGPITLLVTLYCFTCIACIVVNTIGQLSCINHWEITSKIILCILLTGYTPYASGMVW